jgi:hypothetical protein
MKESRRLNVKNIVLQVLDMNGRILWAGKIVSRDRRMSADCNNVAQDEIHWPDLENMMRSLGSTRI